MDWDIYTLTSVISGGILVVGAFIPEAMIKAKERLLLLTFGIAAIAYGIYVARQTSGTYEFPVQMFFVPVIAVIYVVYKILESKEAQPQQRQQVYPPPPPATMYGSFGAARPPATQEPLPPREFVPTLKRLKIDLSRVDSSPDGVVIAIRESDIDLGSRPWSELKVAVTKEIRRSGHITSGAGETGQPGNREIRVKVSSAHHGGRPGGIPWAATGARSESLSRLSQIPGLPAPAVRKRVALDMRREQGSGVQPLILSIAERDIDGGPATWLGSLAAARETVEVSGARLTAVDISGAEGNRIARLTISTPT